MLTRPEVILENERRMSGEARNEDPIYRIIRDVLEGMGD
jgi:hypothetical protein